MALEINMEIRDLLNKTNKMETLEQTKKLNEIAIDAYSKRTELIKLFKKQKKGNVVLKLVHGCVYVYGETVKNPEINFGAGLTIKDTDLWSKTIWK